MWPNLQVSISAEASFPVVPKWILMNLPCKMRKYKCFVTYIFRIFKEDMVTSVGPFLRAHTYKSWGVVIPHSFGISKSLQQRVRWNDLILQRPLKNTADCFRLTFFFFFTPGLFLIGRFTCILPDECSFLSPPDTAIVAKYWMTRLVLTVFPAPDSPLWTKNKDLRTPKKHHSIHLIDYKTRFY